MTNAFTPLIFLGPLVVVLAFVVMAMAERNRAGAAAEPGFFARNGVAGRDFPHRRRRPLGAGDDRAARSST